MPMAKLLNIYTNALCICECVVFVSQWWGARFSPRCRRAKISRFLRASFRQLHDAAQTEVAGFVLSMKKQTRGALFLSRTTDGRIYVHQYRNVI